MISNNYPSSFSYQKYYNPSQPLILSPEAVQYFQTLELLIQDPMARLSKGIVPEMMIQGWRNFSKREKVRYVTENLRYLASITKKKNGGGMEGPYILTRQPKTIQVNCQTKYFLCFYRNTTTLKLETEPRTLLLSTSDTIKMIDLQNYLVHSGKTTFGNKIFLEPLTPAGKSWSDVRRYEFTLEEREFQKIYGGLFGCVMDVRNQELVVLFGGSGGMGGSPLRSDIVKYTPAAIREKIISKKQYEDFSKFKNTMLNQKGISYLSFRDKIYQEQNTTNPIGKTKLTIKHNPTTSPSLFKTKIFTNQCLYQVKQRLLSVFQQLKHPLLIESQLLETYEQSPTNCVALFQKYYINGTGHGAIFMREVLSVTNLLLGGEIKSIMKIEEKKRYDEFMFFRAIDSPLVRSFFQWMAVFVKDATKTGGSFQSQVVIIGQFNINQHFTTAMVIEFLCEYYHAAYEIQGGVHIDLIKKQSFKTSNTVVQKKMIQAINTEEGHYDKSGEEVTGSGGNSNSNGNGKEVMVEFAEPDTGTRLARNKFIGQERDDTEKTEKNGMLFYRNRFGLKPIQGYKIEQNTVKQNFMHGEWKKGEDGGLVCTNEKLLAEHKKIFKHVLASIGSNILKGGNILNVSLPVTIFKKQGHLQMIADSFSLSPKLLENVSDPLERMKRAILVSIAVGTLGISVEKPFFPTLGQTLQVWIGGCPMYLQQILRYPPTGAYLFYGRGYRIYGQVEPKISFGLNGVKGYSQRFSFIEFDDGQKIELSYGKLVIGGIFMGDRDFNFFDKVFAYDKDNNYFAQLIFGAKDKQVFGKNLQTKDFLYGKIYQLTSQFAHKFTQAEPPKPYPTKKYIKNILSEFEGYWNGIVKFDDKQYIDFEKDLPCRVQPEEYALPSDTRFRKDLVNLLAGNIDEAQRQKELLEEEQRRNRTLRASKSSKKK